MTRRCVVKWCCLKKSGQNHEFFEGGKKLTFHKFPAKPEMRKKWCDQVNVNEADLKITSTVCCIHFSNEMFGNKSKTQPLDVSTSGETNTKLKKTAYPDINLTHPPSGADTPVLVKVISTSRPLAITRVRQLSVEKIQAQRRERKSMNQKLYRLSAKCKRYKFKVGRLEMENRMKTKAVAVLSKLYASSAGKLIENQVRNLDRKKTGLRYDEEILAFACSIFRHSQAAYHIIRSKLNLPNPSTLRKILALSANSMPQLDKTELVDNVEKTKWHVTGDMSDATGDDWILKDIEDIEDIEGSDTAEEENDFEEWIKNFKE